MQVWKYPLPLTDSFEIEMPLGAQCLSVQVQEGAPQLWVLCDPDESTETRKFRLAGTGNTIEPGTLSSFVGTFQLHDGAFVGHVFERNPYTT